MQAMLIAWTVGRGAFSLAIAVLLAGAR